MTEIPENLESERALHLIAKGREVFLKLGYRATTMRDIAQAAGMSRPAVYLVFANKDAVFRASFIRSMRRRLMQLREDIDPAWPLERQLHHALEIIIAQNYDKISVNPAARDVLSYDHELPGVAEAFAEAVEFLAQLIRAPLSSSGLTDDASHLARTLLTAVNGFKLACKDGDDLRRLMDSQIRLLVVALDQPLKS